MRPSFASFDNNTGARIFPAPSHLVRGPALDSVMIPCAANGERRGGKVILLGERECGIQCRPPGFGQHF